MGRHNHPKKAYGAPVEKADPGASGSIYVDRSPCVINLVSATTETRTLARPYKAGLECLLNHRTDGGDITVTVTGGYNELGATTFVLSDAGQYAEFRSIETATSGTFRWLMTSSHILGDMAGLTATAAEINARAAAASRIVNIADATTYAVLAADSGKIHIIPELTADCTITLPTAAAGLEYEFIGKGVAVEAQNWIFKSPSATNYFIGGVAFIDTDAGAGADEAHAGIYSNGSTNDFLTLVTPAPAGTRIYVICDGTNWIVNGVVYSATVPAFSDT